MNKKQQSVEESWVEGAMKVLGILQACGAVMVLMVGLVLMADDKEVPFLLWGVGLLLGAAWWLAAAEVLCRLRMSEQLLGMILGEVSAAQAREEPARQAGAQASGGMASAAGGAPALRYRIDQVPPGSRVEG